MDRSTLYQSCTCTFGVRACCLEPERRGIRNDCDSHSWPILPCSIYIVDRVAPGRGSIHNIYTPMYILLCFEGAINVRMHRSVEIEALQGCMHCSTFSAMSYMCSVCVCMYCVYTCSFCIQPHHGTCDVASHTKRTCHIRNVFAFVEGKCR